jgi:hypothetical protein
MIDFAPRKFLEEVDRLVVPQFGKLEDLNVFVSAVRDGDCVGGGGGGRREEGRAWWCIRTHVEEEKEEEEVAEEVKEWFPAGKRNRVCEMVREVLLGRMAVARLGEGKGGRDGEKKGGHGGKAQADVRVMECVLTTLAHQVPPRFEEALTFLREGAREGGREGGREVEKEGRGSQGQDRVNYHLKGEVASRLLRFLSFFTDMDALYRVALGMYDVTLARAIARLSPKMDPREYLPFLEDAEKLMGKEEGGEGKGWKGKVTIDLFLSRPLRALEVMAWEGGGEGEDGGEVEEEVVVDLVQTHGFEEAAVPLFVQERFPSLHGRLLGLWAARLMAEKAYGKALVVWVARAGKKKGGRKGGREGPGEGGRERRESLLKAAECARLSEDWRMALLLVGEVEKEEGREGGRTGSSSLVEHWARQMVGNLVGGVGGGREEKVRLQEGARICWEYLRDVEGAVDALTRAGEWREAMRVARKGGREDLVETDICMGVKEAVVGLQSWVEGGRARWKEGRRRLEEMVGRVVREDEEKEAAEVARRGRGREGGGGGGSGERLFRPNGGLEDEFGHGCVLPFGNVLARLEPFAVDVDSSGGGRKRGEQQWEQQQLGSGALVPAGTEGGWGRREPPATWGGGASVSGEKEGETENQIDRAGGGGGASAGIGGVERGEESLGGGGEASGGLAPVRRNEDGTGLAWSFAGAG